MVQAHAANQFDAVERAKDVDALDNDVGLGQPRQGIIPIRGGDGVVSGPRGIAGIHVPRNIRVDQQNDGAVAFSITERSSLHSRSKTTLRRTTASESS
jgi:hypothetical protein